MHSAGLKEAVIVSAFRTPIGSYKGNLAGVSAIALGSIAAKACLDYAGIKRDQVGELLFGNVLPANLGQAPARQVALRTGLSEATVCTTINKVCASGLKAVTLGCQSISLGHHDTVVAGGMENMSSVPYYLNRAREGLSMGHQTLVDGMLWDGLTDANYNIHMGMCGEEVAEKYNIGRQEQDAYAIRSYERARHATERGLYKSEIVPVPVVSAKLETTIDTDEEPLKIDGEKLKMLKPVFKKDATGTITAANASKVSDGASSVLLMEAGKASQMGLRPLARVLGYADAECSPKDFPVAPALAIPVALKRAGLALQDVSLFEINEAFSVVAIVNQRILGLDSEKVNVSGGAVALGHPLGSSGCRILVTLTHLLKQGQVGVAAICNGGGGATAIVIEKLA